MFIIFTRPGSIRSSPRYGLSTPYRLTIRNIVLFNMGDLHSVLTPLNLSTLNAGILIMMQLVRLMMFSLNTVGYSMSFLLRGWGGVVAHGFLGLGLRGLGPGLDNLEDRTSRYLFFVLSLNIKLSIYRIKTDLAPLLSEVSQRKSELLNFENSINTRKSELEKYQQEIDKVTQNLR